MADQIKMYVENGGNGVGWWQRISEGGEMVSSGGPFPNKVATLEDVQLNNPDNVTVEIELGPDAVEESGEDEAEDLTSLLGTKTLTKDDGTVHVVIEAPAAEAQGSPTEE